MAAIPAPGWFTDPLEPRIERWWSGSAWTAMIRLRHDTTEIATSPPGEGMPAPSRRHASGRTTFVSVPLVISLSVTAVVTTASWWVLYEWMPSLGTALGGT